MSPSKVSAERPYLLEDYPDLFRCLAVAAERELAGSYPDAAELAFQISEGPRRKLGGNLLRFPAYREEPDHADLFGDHADIPRPDRPPEVVFNRYGSAIDLIAYVTEWTAWTIAQRDETLDGHAIHTLTTAIVRRFHRDADGRDQKYVPKGSSFDKRLIYRRMWEDYKGHNFAELAVAYGVTEMRARQIIDDMRREEVARRQAPLPGIEPPNKKGRTRP
jgi:Mor family transcriptional regulator